jgi:anti-sigma regulatory factor (Ser/Thr protein kinase)
MGALDGQRRADLHVAVSELVTNAVVHGPSGEVSLHISLDGRTIRVEVADEGMQPFEWPEVPEPSQTGWGLALVRSFTDRCGIDRRPFTVAWCELDFESAG